MHLCTVLRFLIKYFFCFLFVTEYFDNFLSVDHLFDITIYITKSFLLTYKIITTLSGNTSCHLKHDKYKAEYKNGKLPACEKHGKNTEMIVIREENICGILCASI